jgi:hypothetical protein
MSFVTTQPEALTAAAGNLEAIGTALAAQDAAAAAPTTPLVPAAADEVSALQAMLFSAYGNLYQQISSQATAIQQMFVHTLGASAGSYDATEAANSAAAGSGTGAGLTGLGGALTGTGALAGTGASAGADPSFGLGGALSNAGILAGMQGGTIGGAASEFTGLGKGFISEPAGSGFAHGVMVSEAAPASAAASAAPTPAVPTAPAPVSASAGQASSVGKLSVPPSWAGEAVSVSGPAPATLAGAGWAAPAPHSAPPATIPAGMPAAASADRGGSGFGRPRYGVKPTVMPRHRAV